MAAEAATTASSPAVEAATTASKAVTEAAATVSAPATEVAAVVAAVALEEGNVEQGGVMEETPKPQPVADEAMTDVPMSTGVVPSQAAHIVGGAADQSLAVEVAAAAVEIALAAMAIEVAAANSLVADVTVQEIISWAVGTLEEEGEPGGEAEGRAQVEAEGGVEPAPRPSPTSAVQQLVQPRSLSGRVSPQSLPDHLQLSLSPSSEVDRALCLNIGHDLDDGRGWPAFTDTVAVAEPEAKARAARAAEVEVEAEADAEVEAEVETEAQVEAEVEAEVETEVEAAAKTVAKAEAEATAEAEVEVEAEAAAEVEVEAEAAAAAAAEAEAEAEVEAEAAALAAEVTTAAAAEAALERAANARDAVLAQLDALTRGLFNRYTDPAHPDGWRSIDVDEAEGWGGGETVGVRVRGSDARDGAEWAVSGVASRGVLVVDFSAKGGPSDLEGKQLSGGGIVWSDGNVWPQVDPSVLAAERAVEVAAAAKAVADAEEEAAAFIPQPPPKQKRAHMDRRPRTDRRLFHDPTSLLRVHPPPHPPRSGKREAWSAADSVGRAAGDAGCGLLALSTPPLPTEAPAQGGLPSFYGSSSFPLPVWARICTHASPRMHLHACISTHASPRMHLHACISVRVSYACISTHARARTRG